MEDPTLNVPSVTASAKSNDDSATFEFLSLCADNSLEANTVENSSFSHLETDYFFANPTAEEKGLPAKKSVDFFPKVLGYRVLGLWEYTPEEVEATWRTEEDERRSQKELLAEVRAMRKAEATGNAVEEEAICTRGIEHMRSKEHTEKRKRLKEMVVLAVMEEQEIQRRTNFHNSQDLASASDHISKLHKANARKKAGEDAAFAGERRLSLPAQYAAAMRRLSGPSFNSRTSSGEELGKMKRNSSISYEKHQDVIFEELNAIIDCTDSSDDEESDDEDAKINPRSCSILSDRAVYGSFDSFSIYNDPMDSNDLAIISKIEVCIIDKEVHNSNLSIVKGPISKEDDGMPKNLPSHASIHKGKSHFLSGSVGQRRASFTRKAHDNGPWDYCEVRGMTNTGGVSRLSRICNKASAA